MAKSKDNDVDVREGDWVRFYRGGVLVIEEVRYVGEAKFSTRLNKNVVDVLTINGQTSSDNIVECRRLAEYILP